MEGLYGNNTSSKAPKKKKLMKENISPINPHNFIGKSRHKHYPTKSPVVFDPYASSDNTNSPNPDSLLIKYLSIAASGIDSFKSPVTDVTKSSGGFGRPRGYLAVIENLESAAVPAVYKTQVKEEDDVLVMDGILLSSTTPRSSTKNMMMTSSSSSSKGRSLVTSSDLSGGTSSSSSSSTMGNSGEWYYKMETCWSWEDSSHCRFGSKCQFAHGKEEQRPTRFPNNKNEAQISKLYSSGSSPIYSPTGRVAHSQVTAAASTNQPVSPIKIRGTTSSPTIVFRNAGWSPRDDGIEVALPCCDSPKKISSREEVESSVLYGPIRRKRLLVFAEICPE